MSEIKMAYNVRGLPQAAESSDLPAEPHY